MKTCHVCLTVCDDSAELCPLCGAQLRTEEEQAEINANETHVIKEPVLLASLEDVVSVEIFKDILKDNGIVYYCDDSAGEGTMQVLFGGSFIAENIYVDSSDFEAADKLYTEFCESEEAFDGEFFEDTEEE